MVHFIIKEWHVVRRTEKHKNIKLQLEILQSLCQTPLGLQSRDKGKGSRKSSTFLNIAIFHDYGVRVEKRASSLSPSSKVGLSNLAKRIVQNFSP